jgi:hypothetical protein
VGGRDCIMMSRYTSALLVFCVCERGQRVYAIRCTGPVPLQDSDTRAHAPLPAVVTAYLESLSQSQEIGAPNDFSAQRRALLHDRLSQTSALTACPARAPAGGALRARPNTLGAVRAREALTVCGAALELSIPGIAESQPRAAVTT